MQKTTTALATPLREQPDRLAAFEPSPGPVLSPYLDMRADQHGRNTYDVFLRKAFPERSRSVGGKARKSLDRDAQRIRAYLDTVGASSKGLALFACAAANDFFETVQLDVPVAHHWLFVGSVPHLYPLARINDQFPRYAGFWSIPTPRGCSCSASATCRRPSACRTSRPDGDRSADGRRHAISGTSRTFICTT